MAYEYFSLSVDISSAQAVHTGLADGKDLRVLGTTLQESKILIGECVHTIPGVKTHRVPAARPRIKMPRVHRDKRCGGIEAMGMAVKDVHLRF